MDLFEKAKADGTIAEEGMTEANGDIPTIEITRAIHGPDTSARLRVVTTASESNVTVRATAMHIAIETCEEGVMIAAVTTTTNEAVNHAVGMSAIKAEVATGSLGRESESVIAMTVERGPLPQLRKSLEVEGRSSRMARLLDTNKKSAHFFQRAASHVGR